MTKTQYSQSQTVDMDNPTRSEHIVDVQAPANSSYPMAYVGASTPSSNANANEPKRDVDGASVVAPEIPSTKHPKIFRKGTKQHREALEAFFELSIESPAICTAKKDVNCAEIKPACHRGRVHDLGCIDKPQSDSDSITSIHMRSENDATLASILDQYILPNAAAVVRTADSSVTMIELRETYSSVCTAVAEIQLTASTLRTNSRALTVAKNLVNGSAFDIFKVLDDFQPRPGPDVRLAGEVTARLNKWAATKKQGWKVDCDNAQRMKELVNFEHSTERNQQRARDWACRLAKAFATHRRASVLEICGDKLTREMVWEKAELPTGGELWSTMNEIVTDNFDHTFAGFDVLMDLLYIPILSAWERYWERECARDQKKQPEEDLRLSIATIYWSKYSFKAGFPRMAEERERCEWMKDEVRTHPNIWTEKELQILELWWSDVEEWETRWESRTRAVVRLAETCLDLLVELGRIDGCASSNELNIFSPGEEDRSFVDDCSMRIIIELVFGQEGQFRRHLNDLFTIILKRLKSNSLRQGFDALIKTRDHFRSTFMDFATVAIFFSSITATTLQFSFASADQSTSSRIVNLCWFASLVLSIASATNSFLGAIVHQSPEYLRPSASFNFRFLQSWFKYVPPMLLSISGLLFLIGICAFTFLSTTMSPDQGPVVKHVTVSLTSSNIFALFVMILLAFTRLVPPIILFMSLPLRIAFFLGFFSLILPPYILGILYGLLRYRVFMVPHRSLFAKALTVIFALLMPVGNWCEEGLLEFYSLLREILWSSLRFVHGSWARIKSGFLEYIHRDPVSIPVGEGYP